MNPDSQSQAAAEVPRPHMTVADAHRVADYLAQQDFRRFLLASVTLMGERRAQLGQLADDDELALLVAGVARGASFQAGLLCEVAAKLDLAATTMQAALMVRDDFAEVWAAGPGAVAQ